MNQARGIRIDRAQPRGEAFGLTSTTLNTCCAYIILYLLEVGRRARIFQRYLFILIQLADLFLR